MTSRRAVIDIGTNSVKLLVAEVTGNTVHPLHECSEQTRLGRGFYQTHRLAPRAIRSTARAVAAFATEAGRLGAERVRVLATSAARDARNAHDLLEAVLASSGLAVEIISGEQEAAWAFRGVLTDPRWVGHPVLVLDVGGGSTEFILGAAPTPIFQASHPLGSVRLLEQRPPSDPPTPTELADCRRAVREFLDDRVAPAIEPFLGRYPAGSLRVVGTGGTASVLASLEQGLTAFDRDRIEQARFSAARLETWLDRLWSLPLVERRRLPGLPPERADVILTGVAIYAGVLCRFDLSTLEVSTRGLRFAALLNGHD